MQKINFENYPSTNSPINATNLNQIQTNVETEFNKNDSLRSARTIRSNENNITLTISSAWGDGVNVPLSVANDDEACGDKILYDSTNKCIEIGAGVNHVEISANILIRGIPAAMFITIMKNNNRISQAYGLTPTNTAMWQCVSIGNVVTSVSEGDKIYLNAGAGDTGTLGIGSSVFTSLTVKAID